MPAPDLPSSCFAQGFQQQVRHWPTQPLDTAVAWVSRLPTAAVVADFGCGQAQLASQVPHQVISLDLVAAVPGVLACDMAHTPLGMWPSPLSVWWYMTCGPDSSIAVHGLRVFQTGHAPASGKWDLS